MHYLLFVCLVTDQSSKRHCTVQISSHIPSLNALNPNKPFNAIAITGEHHHLVLQVVVHGDPEDGVHVALGAGVPGHAGHPSLEEAD